MAGKLVTSNIEVRVTSDTQKIQSSDWPKWRCMSWHNKYKFNDKHKFLHFLSGIGSHCRYVNCCHTLTSFLFCKVVFNHNVTQCFWLCKLALSHNIFLTWNHSVAKRTINRVLSLPMWLYYSWQHVDSEINVCWVSL